MQGIWQSTILVCYNNIVSSKAEVKTGHKENNDCATMSLEVYMSDSHLLGALSGVCCFSLFYTSDCLLNGYLDCLWLKSGVPESENPIYIR